MQLREKRIKSTNRGFGDLGDEKAGPGLSHEVEDRLIEILDRCIVGPLTGASVVTLWPFREFLRSDYGRRAGWNRTNIELCLASDNACEGTILFTAAKLKRMQHRHEWCVNELIQRGLPLDMIPTGQEYLGC